MPQRFYLNCKIHNLDLQMCYNAHRWSKNDDSFAEIFVKNDNIDYVYGTPDSICFNSITCENYTNPFDSVETDDQHFYRYSCFNGNLDREQLASSLPVMFRIAE